MKFVRIPGTNPRTLFRIALDDVTVARLIELAEACGADPNIVAAAIVRDVLEDDALAHDADLASAPVPLH